MGKMATRAALDGLVSAARPAFSANDERIADYLLAHPDQAAFGSAGELAARIGVSKAALVRFGARLGLGGFGGLQELLEGDLRRRLEPDAPHAAAAGGVLERTHEAIGAGLAASVAETGSAAVERAAAVLDSGEGWIHVFGQRASAAVAEYAFFLLNPILPNVVRVEAGESALADHLLDVGPEDRLLAITFRRYAKLTGGVIDYFSERQAPVVLVTDSRSAPAADRAAELLVASDGGEAAFPTVVPGVFMLEALVAAVVERNPERAARRRGDAERVWGRFGTY